MKPKLLILAVLIGFLPDLFSQYHSSNKTKVPKYSASLVIMNNSLKQGCILELNDSTVTFEEKSNPKEILTLAVPVNSIEQINFVKHGNPPAYVYGLVGFIFGGLVGYVGGSQESSSIIDPGPVFTSLVFGAVCGGIGFKIGNTEYNKTHRELRLTFPIHGNLNNYKSSRQKMRDLLK